MVVLVIALIIGGILWWLDARHYEDTDDAFIDTHIVHIAPQIAGQVIAIRSMTISWCIRAMSLPEINPQDAQARAGPGPGAGGAGRRPNCSRRWPARAARWPRPHNAASDLARYRALQADQSPGRGAAAGRPGRGRRPQCPAPSVAPPRPRSRAPSAQIKTLAGPDRQPPSINLGYTQIAAPVDGHVTQRSVALGNYVTPGQDLMAIVPLQLWVTANFKETQLALMRPGQPVTRRGRCLRRRRYSRPCQFHPARRRPGLRHPAAGKRHRQLRQGGAARAGEDRARPGAQGLRAGPGHERRAHRQGALMAQAAGSMRGSGLDAGALGRRQAQSLDHHRR